MLQQEKLSSKLINVRAVWYQVYIQNLINSRPKTAKLNKEEGEIIWFNFIFMGLFLLILEYQEDQLDGFLMTHRNRLEQDMIIMIQVGLE